MVSGRLKGTAKEVCERPASFPPKKTLARIGTFWPDQLASENCKMNEKPPPSESFDPDFPAFSAFSAEFPAEDTSFDPSADPLTEPPLDPGPATLSAWPGTLVASFLDRCALDPTTGCWNWLGKMSHGRHPVWLFYGHSGSALALAWELFVGPPPKHGVIRRTCQNPLCVRPDHLTLQQGLKVKGRKSGGVKLTPEAILYIRSSALSKATLARKFGVTTWTIWAVKTGRRGGLTTIAPDRVFQDPSHTKRTQEIQRISQKLRREIRAPAMISAPANSPAPGLGYTTPSEAESLDPPQSVGGEFQSEQPRQKQDD